MLVQRVYKNGNSVAVTIPKELKEDLNLKPGSSVVVERKENGVLITPHAKKLASDVNSEFAKMVDEFINDHEDVLKKLAHK